MEDPDIRTLPVRRPAAVQVRLQGQLERRVSCRAAPGSGGPPTLVSPKAIAGSQVVDQRTVDPAARGRNPPPQVAEGLNRNPRKMLEARVFLREWFGGRIGLSPLFDTGLYWLRSTGEVSSRGATGTGDGKVGSGRLSSLFLTSHRLSPALDSEGIRSYEPEPAQSLFFLGPTRPPQKPYARPDGADIPGGFDKHGPHLPTCDKGGAVGESGSEEQASSARSGTRDVFISYASPDTPIANDVPAALEGQGLPRWIAPRDVTPGAHYASEIVHAIDSAKAIVLILSQDAGGFSARPQGDRASDLDFYPVVALRVDQAALPAEFEYFLNTSQWLDASGGNAARMMSKLVAAVRLAIERPASPGPVLQVTAAAGAAALVSRATSGGNRLR